MFGVSTSCFYPMYTEESILKLLDLGIGNIEIFFNAAEECSHSYISSVLNLLNDRGTRVLSTHTYTSAFEHYMLFSEYERRRTEIHDSFRTMMEATCLLGATCLTFHGERLLPTSKTDSFACERYASCIFPVLESAKEYGLFLCQENVSWCKSSSPDFIKNVSDILEHPNFGFTLDIKQATRSGIPVSKYIDALGSIVRNVHISDNNDILNCVLPGKGTFDFASLFDRLKSSGYRGNYIIEVYSNSFSQTSDIKKSYEHICSFA